MQTTMQSYSEIQAQIADLMKKADEARKAEIANVVAEMRKTIHVYGLKPSDLFPSLRAEKSITSRKEAPVKYRDGNGHTWAGRGKMPRWMKSAIEAGATLESFKVA